MATVRFWPDGEFANGRFGDSSSQNLDLADWPAREAAATITFEEIGDLLHALSPARLALIQAVKSEPGSITSLAQRLNLDRSAVTRDVELLRQLGILEVEDRPEAGHHRQKWVSPPCAAHEVGGTRVRDEASRRRERVAFRVAMAASH